jgi:ribonuclease HII
MRKKMSILYEFDKNYKKIIVGVDEAGRGPLAGPVVASAVIIDEYIEEFDMINDSKKISEKKRELLYDIIMEKCEVGVGIVDHKEIDKYNILNATFMAMKRAIEEIASEYDIVLVDGNHKIRDFDKKQEAVIKGDGKSLSIAAASIVAKVTRDRIMVEYAKDYPEYLFEKHKGYGTKAHREVLVEKGATPIHRKSFLKKILG